MKVIQKLAMYSFRYTFFYIKQHLRRSQNHKILKSQHKFEKLGSLTLYFFGRENPVVAQQWLPPCSLCLVSKWRLVALHHGKTVRVHIAHGSMLPRLTLYIHSENISLIYTADMPTLLDMPFK